MAENIKINIKESFHVLYWAVMNRSSEFQPGFLMTDLIIEPKHKVIVQHILNLLIQKTECKPLLKDGVCLLHLAVVVGHMLEKSDESVDLMSNFLVSSSGKVNFICPWTGKSSIDFTLERGLKFNSKQLYTLGCRAVKMVEEENELTKVLFKVRIPSGESGNAYEGMIKFNDVLEKWRNNESDLIEELYESIVEHDDHNKKFELLVIQKVSTWLEEEINSQDVLPFQTKLKISGSISEETKIRPLDEIDFIIQCKLKVDLQVSDENSNKDWMYSSALELSPVERKLTKIDSKQPFPHLANVILAAEYPGLGGTGDILEPETFSKFMEDFVWRTLTERNLPDIIHLPQGKNFLEQTKSGFFMNLEYELNGSTQEMTIDLVSVLTLSRENYEYIRHVMPKYEMNKFRFLQENKLLSSNDGIIVKKGNWRMSFSNGEKKLICLHRDLFRVLKYLNKASEHHIDIPTYYLKEIFCSFIVHQGINDRPLNQASLALSLAELITFCDMELISSPFYCTKLGSHVEKNCVALFRRFKDKFLSEFEYFSYLHGPGVSHHHRHSLADCIASGFIWPAEQNLLYSR
eukprot:GFUD01006609.1.p1 GENE.GFUD01006609.1~~GFUD01006609.1.p1  ORF type:complete len:663 (+),score=138.53 GFUD01006609.1:264-1991(+)